MKKVLTIGAVAGALSLLSGKVRSAVAKAAKTASSSARRVVKKAKK